MKTLRLQIEGRVQGVWFRESMRREAERLGVAGWVRNAPDGSVEAVVQGADEAVDALIEWAQTGPPLARVDPAHTEQRPGRIQQFREAVRLKAGTANKKMPGFLAGQSIHHWRRIGGDNTKSLCGNFVLLESSNITKYMSTPFSTKRMDRYVFTPCGPQ